MNTHTEPSREDKLVYALVITMILLLTVLVWLNRTPLCVSSGLVSSVRVLFDEGSAQVARCQTRLPFQETGRISFPELSSAISRLNHTLKVLESSLGQELRSKRGTSSLVVDLRTQVPSQTDQRLTRGARALLVDEVSSLGAVAHALTSASGSLVMEFHRARAFGSDAAFQFFWERPESWRELLVRELLMVLPRPLVGRDVEKVVSYLQGLDVLIAGSPEIAPGALTLQNPEYQESWMNMVRARSSIEKLSLFLAARNEFQGQQVLNDWITRLDRAGFNPNPKPLVFDVLVHLDGLFEAERESFLLAFEESEKSALAMTQTEVQTKTYRAPIALMPQIRGADSVDVHCGAPQLRRLKNVSQQSFRMLLIRHCPGEAQIKWSALLSSDVQRFVEANSDLDFVHLHSGYVAEISHLAEATWIEKWTNILKGQAQEMVLALRQKKS